jgi:hypothetical protein
LDVLWFSWRSLQCTRYARYARYAPNKDGQTHIQVSISTCSARFCENLNHLNLTILNPILLGPVVCHPILFGFWPSEPDFSSSCPCLMASQCAQSRWIILSTTRMWHIKDENLPENSEMVARKNSSQSLKSQVILIALSYFIAKNRNYIDMTTANVRSPVLIFIQLWKHKKQLSGAKLQLHLFRDRVLYQAWAQSANSMTCWGSCHIVAVHFILHTETQWWTNRSMYTQQRTPHGT